MQGYGLAQSFVAPTVIAGGGVIPTGSVMSVTPAGQTVFTDTAGHVFSGTGAFMGTAQPGTPGPMPQAPTTFDLGQFVTNNWIWIAGGAVALLLLVRKG
jgi:hypothetical protein